MVLRYWLEDGHTTAIQNVDRVVFNSLHDMNIRFAVSDLFQWQSLGYGVDYIQFTVTKE